MKPTESQRELLLRYLDGRLTAEERSAVNELLRAEPAARAFLRALAEQAVMISDLEREAQGRREVLGGHATLPSDPGRSVAAPGRTPTTPFTKALLAIAAMLIVALTAGLYFQWIGEERRVAKVTGSSGALQWTGNGGRVVRNLSIGTELSGGTIEGMVPDSWFELEFNDGSTVAISGNSVLTFSDDGQKRLYLKEGNLSGNVRLQPAGRPMLIHTRPAMLEVVGTQFEVEADLAATMLDVTKGIVRVRRLSDGATVDVPANHRLMAATDRDLLPVPIPASVNRWRSQLQWGPDRTLGKWSPPKGQQGASIATVPYTTEQGWTIFALGLGVSCGNEAPVILIPGTRLRVRGHMASSHPVFFGVTVRRENGEFAGKFQTIRPAVEFAAGQSFEALLDLRDFGLDPTLNAWKDKLPITSFHLVVESVWCHTLDKQAGLEVTEIEFLPPTEEK